MATLREIITRFGFKVDKAGLTRANSGMRQLQTQTQKTGRAARVTGQAFAGIGTAILAQGLQQARRAVGFLTTDFAASTDAAAKQARALGISIGSLQRLQFASKIAGASQKDVSTGLRVLAKRLRDARNGLSTAKLAFAEVGISAKSLKGQKLDVVFKRLANRFAGISDPATKAALAQELFGRGGLALVNTLNLGSQGITKLGDRAKRLGIVLSAQAAAKAEKFTDSMLEAKSAVKGIRNVLAGELLPKITALATKFANFIATGDNLAKTVARVKIAAKALAAVFTVLTLAKFGPLGVVLGIIALLVKQLLKGKEGMKALKEIGAAFATLSKALAPIFAQLVNAVKPLLPVFVQLIGAVAKVLALMVQALGPAFVLVIKVVAEVFAFVIKGAVALFKFLGKVWKKIVGVMRPTIRALGAAFKAVGSVVTSVVGGIRSAFESVFSFLRPAISFIGKAFGLALKPIVFLANGIKTVFNGVAAAVSKIAAFARKIANNPVVKFIIKGGKFIGKIFGGTGQAAGFAKRITADAKRQTRAGRAAGNVSVGQVSVNVQGSTGMGSEAMKDAVRRGTQEAIGNISREALRDFSKVE